MDTLIQSDEDFSFEEDIIRDPYQLKTWTRYIEAKQVDQNSKNLNVICERALKQLPGSYKLWFIYLNIRMKQVESQNINDPAWLDVNSTFERALTTTMYKMPRIWEEYIKFLMKQHLVTKTRNICDMALQHLPVTQHYKIWKIYKSWTRLEYIPMETVKRVWKRYLLLEPHHLEEYVSILISKQDYNEACLQLFKLVSDDTLKSMSGKSKNELWIELCELISQQAEHITSIDPKKLIKQALTKFTTDVGQFWCYLATFYINSGEPELAYNTFEDSMDHISSVRDFSLVFDAWTKFLYEFVSGKMTMMESADFEEDPEEAQEDLDMWTERLEHVLDKREEMSNTIKLRQNPHNIHEWHKRIKLFSNDPVKVQEIYETAVNTIDPAKAVGKLFLFWINYARTQVDIESMRNVFERAVKQHFRSVDDLAAIWCEWLEIELVEDNIDKVRELFQTATLRPPQKKWIREDLYKDVPPQEKLYKNVKIWTFYVDFEESFGSIDSTREIYDKIIALKISTPVLIVNYASFLEKHKYFEISFKVYEKGINLFSYPQVYHIWVHYLIKFVKRYKDKKIERARDLFEQALIKIPSEFAKNICLLYAKFEEDFGLSRNAMQIYDRSLKLIKQEEMLEMYQIYIHRASEYFGVTKTRDIYEKAIRELPTKHVKDMCLKFADLERKLGEIDRARAIYVFASSYCNPISDSKFWEMWYEFEKFHGNQDTAREMLRVKKSVSASFSGKNVSVTNMVNNQIKEENEAEENRALDLKRKRSENVEVHTGPTSIEENPDEIDLGSEFVIKEKVMPKELFQRNIK